MIKDDLIKLLGDQCNSDANELVRSMRFHQSWWRTCVLAEEQGLYPKKGDGSLIGSCILNGNISLANYMDDYAVRAVRETLDDRLLQKSKGLINEDRLINNLLSSQPLCFNFFGLLKYQKELATQLLKTFFPLVKEVTNILFEFAPNASENGDNSAHDIAIEFIGENNEKGLIGLECKYTEPFSPKEYDKPEYRRIFDLSKAFNAEYSVLTKSSYNQLFRNQLIAESAKLNKMYDVVYGGLFYFQEDTNAKTKGEAFQKMLVDGNERFKLISYQAFLENLQKLDIPWEVREWSMLLWARYCGNKLSNKLRG